MQLSVPEAVVQFRQGFGRLMRSQTDRGIVTLLDKRALVKQYGRIFIDSIPKTKQCFASLEEIVYTVENFCIDRDFMLGVFVLYAVSALWPDGRY